MLADLKITNRCIYCDNCKLICPEKAILKYEDRHIIESWICTLCGLCIETCPVDCIKMIETSVFDSQP